MSHPIETNTSHCDTEGNSPAPANGLASAGPDSSPRSGICPAPTRIAEGSAPEPGANEKRIRIRSLVIDGIRFQSESPEGLLIEGLTMNGIRLTPSDHRALRIEDIALEIS